MSSIDPHIPSDFPLPLPDGEPLVLQIGHHSGRVVFAVRGRPFAAFLPAQVALLMAKIASETAIVLAGEATVNEALNAVEAENRRNIDRASGNASDNGN